MEKSSTTSKRDVKKEMSKLYAHDDSELKELDQNRALELERKSVLLVTSAKSESMFDELSDKNSTDLDEEDYLKIVYRHLNDDTDKKQEPERKVSIVTPPPKDAFRSSISLRVVSSTNLLRRQSTDRASFAVNLRGCQTTSALSDWMKTKPIGERIEEVDSEDEGYYEALQQTKDFPRLYKNVQASTRMYCAKCGKLVETEVGTGVNKCLLVTGFVCFLLMPLLIICAWIPMMCIDDLKSQMLICKKCGAELGKYFPQQKEKPKKNNNKTSKNQTPIEKPIEKPSAKPSPSNGILKKSISSPIVSLTTTRITT